MQSTESTRGIGRNWRDEALVLRANDPYMSNAAIAEAVGVSISSVWRLFNPDAYRELMRRSNARRAAAKRAWENAHDRPACPRCGAPRGVGANRAGNELCRSCADADKRAQWTIRCERIAAMWAAGASMQEIANAEGITRSGLSGLMDRIRREGVVDLPYRYAACADRRVAA